MSNFIAGKKEAMSVNSTKYGYCLEGIAVKTPEGYRSTNGTLVKGAVTTDASAIVKEFVYLENVEAGNIVVINSTPYRVYSASTINDTTKRFELLNLYSGQIESCILDTADRIVGVLWDTLRFPNKAIAGGVAPISLNEFTPQQFKDLADGKVTLEELRTPKTVVSFEDMLKSFIAEAIKGATATV